MRDAATYRAARRNAARGTMWKPTFGNGKTVTRPKVFRLKHPAPRPNVSVEHAAKWMTIAEAVSKGLYRSWGFSNALRRARNSLIRRDDGSY